MRLYLSLALKNVFRQKKRSFTLGINYTVVTFILVLLFAFSAGATRNITYNLVRSTAGHITVSGQYTVDRARLPRRGPLPRDRGHRAAGLGARSSCCPAISCAPPCTTRGSPSSSTFTGIDTARTPASGTRSGSSRELGRFFRRRQRHRRAARRGQVLRPEAGRRGCPGHAGPAWGRSTPERLRSRGSRRPTTSSCRTSSSAASHSYRAWTWAGRDPRPTLFLYLKDIAHLAEKRAALSAALVARGFEATRPASDTEAINAIAAASPTYETDTSGRDYVRLTLSTINESLGIVKSLTGLWRPREC